jgi:hypothetical protein
MMQTNPTAYAGINELLEVLFSSMQKILSEKLVGLYLHGSLVIGDFDRTISDIDLVAALSSELDDKEFEALQTMHDDFAHQHKEWDGRIEVCYVSLAALQTVKTRTSFVANVSPGEPFHMRETSFEWLVSWYLVRETSVTLFGPAPKTIIERISKDEFLGSIRSHVKAWDEWTYDMHHRNSQAYAILTMCRALYTLSNGMQVSKKQATQWAEKEFPEWASLIQNALLWREAWRDENVDHEATFQDTLGFVRFMIRECEKVKRSTYIIIEDIE